MYQYGGWISRRLLDRKLFLLAVLTVCACAFLISVCTVLTQLLGSQGWIKHLTKSDYAEVVWVWLARW